MPERALFLQEARAGLVSNLFAVGPGSNNKKEEKEFCFVRNCETAAFGVTSVDTVTYSPHPRPRRMLPVRSDGSEGLLQWGGGGAGEHSSDLNLGGLKVKPVISAKLKYNSGPHAERKTKWDFRPDWSGLNLSFSIPHSPFCVWASVFSTIKWRGQHLHHGVVKVSSKTAYKDNHLVHSESSINGRITSKIGCRTVHTVLVWIQNYLTSDSKRRSERPPERHFEAAVGAHRTLICIPTRWEYKNRVERGKRFVQWLDSSCWDALNREPKRRRRLTSFSSNQMRPAAVMLQEHEMWPLQVGAGELVLTTLGENPEEDRRRLGRASRAGGKVEGSSLSLCFLTCKVRKYCLPLSVVEWMELVSSSEREKQITLRSQSRRATGLRPWNDLWPRC